MPFLPFYSFITEIFRNSGMNFLSPYYKGFG
ncbi:hypothetical protein BACCAC_02467 [Bacteroides caccae ATCC 43185]|nr:hypothetical protein BACCAC_02467 [Bacteroides caccae ATCC 43185]